jgi:CubicO group peptidase (beta-lactamase class C family)
VSNVRRPAGWAAYTACAWILAFVFNGANRAQPAFDVAALDRFVAGQMAAHNVPGLALVITRGDRVLYLKGYGSARDGQPVTPQTQFFTASLSKSFTALAVMQLVEGGRIDLNAPVQRYLPEFTLAEPAISSQITIRHLLNQTSGLADAGFPSYRLPQPATLAERIDSLHAARLVAPPGTAFHYTDPNYQVLARVVEVVSDQPFSAYLQAHVFTPLQMTRTFNSITSGEAHQQAEHLAQGHLVAYGLPVAWAEMPGFLAGSGGVISTAEDMAHYLIMQANGGRFKEASLLSPESIALMHTPPQNLDSDYAMGWFVTTKDSMRVVEHNGVLSTFYADAFLLPNAGYGVALLYNVNSLASSALAFPRIKGGLIALLTGGRPASSNLSVGVWGLLVGATTLIGVSLGIRSLLRLPRWAAKAHVTPLWRLLPGVVWAFVPALLLLMLPALVAAGSGRVFGYEQLFRAMLGITTWLGLCAALGALNGIARIVLLARRTLRQ